MKKIFFAFCLILCCCMDNSLDDYDAIIGGGDEEKLLADDMVKILSHNGQVTLGTDNSFARESERPVMKVSFSYDYYIGHHEVTCGEFNRLMDGESKIHLNCENDLMPAANVTFYDAVLLANARSKAEQYDTVYMYQKASFNDDGNCIFLEGLSLRWNVDGYRLPTEAEWVFAAQQSWAPSKSWNGGNSDYKAHKVCSFENDEGGVKLCDMAGNLMEWTNDWLGRFQDTSVTNYVGAPDGGKLGERVIKGGCFRNNASAINLFSRGDVYTVTSATKADYVGFRLAYGKVPDPIWLSSDGHATSSRIVPLTTSSTLKFMTGRYKAKLAFRNDVTGNLAYLDYSSATLSVVEIRDTINVYHPEISPNGKLVAFCTKNEGVTGVSSLYVRELNEVGGNLVRLNVESAAIPRWNVLPNGDTVIVYVSDAKNNKDEVEFAKTSTWQVPFSKGQFGTPTKLFDGAYHGGVEGNLAVTGSTILRAHNEVAEAQSKDMVWFGGDQACNVSLSKDGFKQTLFLDFSGAEGREMVGKDYAVHEYLFFADSVGKLTRAIPAPNGFTFDHSEWSVGSFENLSSKNNLVVASLTNLSGAHRKIVLLNTDNNNIVELVEGEELWHPCLWTSGVIEEDSNLDLDSAAMYYSSDAGALLNYKMKLFWKIRDTVEYVALGSSRTSTGFAPAYFTSGRSFNMACIPNDMDVISFLAKGYVFQHTPNLKAIVIGLDLDLWNENPGYNYSLNVGSAPGYSYDKNHDFWKDGVPKSFIRQAENAIVANEFEYEELEKSMGWVQMECGSWYSDGYSHLKIVSDTANSSYLPNYQQGMALLEDVVYTAQNLKIDVVGVVYPQSPYYIDTGAFGRHGLKRSLATNMLKEIHRLEERYSNFHVLDENKMGNHDYPDEMAYDYDHLCRSGGIKITQRIDSLIATLK